MSLRDAIESGNYQNYFSDESNQKKKKKTLREAIEDGTYQNYFEDTDEPEKIQNDSFFKKSEGNTFETILGTTGDIAINLAKGGFGIGEKIGDLLTYAHAGLEEKIGNQEKADSLRRNAQESTTDFLFGGLEKKVDKNSVIGDRGDAVVEGLGYVAGMTAISLASGGAATALGASASTAGLVATAASTATTFSSAMGGAMSEAYKNGANNDEAFKYGVIGGLAEAGSELLFGGLGKASKAVGLAKSAVPVDDMLAKKVSGVFKSKLAKNLSQYAIKAGAEGTEELVSGFISAIGKKVTYMKEEDFNKIVKNENLLEQFVDGMIISGITQAPGLVKSTTKGRDFLSGYTDNENKVYEKLVNDKVNNELKNSTIEQEYSKRVDEQEKMLARDLTEQEKLQVQKEVEEAFDKNEISVESDIDSKKRKEIEEQVKEDLQNGKIDTKQIREILGENTDISKDTLLQNSYIQEQRKSQLYIYEKTESAPKNAVMESAVNANMNNTEISRNLINYVAKVSEDTGVAYRFVNNEQLKELGYSKENKIINGVVSKNGVVYLNSQSKEAINYVLGHETTHLLENTKEYTDLQNLVLEYAKQTGVYEETINSIKETYSDILETSEEFTNELTSELTSRLLFTDESFISELSVKQPNVFQKIFDYIKHMIKMTTAGSEEAKQLEKIKYSFEKAYKNIDRTITNKFSVQTASDGSKYVQVDTDQNIFSGIEKKDYNKIAKMYMQDYLMGETQLSKSDEAIIDKKSANKYTNPGKRQQNFDKKMQLTPELKNVLEIAQIDSTSVPTKDTSKYKNWEYYKFNFELDGKSFEGTINIGIDGNGNKHFYEINKIKEIDDISGKNLNRSSTSFIKDSIPSSSKDVNTSTKYSMQESENDSQLSEKAKRELHRYVHMNKEELNKAFSDVIENKENMLEEYNRLSNEYKEYQKSEDFTIALKNSDYEGEAFTKAGKYAEKLRYYNEQYEKYKSQQEAINSLLMGNKTDTRSVKQVIKEAEKHFGITSNFKETAYIDIDGNQIDFSGKHEGGMSGSRSLDHRQINEIDVDMQSFIDMGNIRIIPEGNGINLSIEPNAKQYAKLEKYIDSVNGEIYIDIDKTNTTYDSIEYKKGTSTSKIINDLQYYFRNGKFPKQSDLAQFRYSTQKESKQDVFDKVIPQRNDYKVTAEDVAITETKNNTETEETNIPISEKYQNEQEEKVRTKAVQYANRAKNRFIRKFTQDMKIDETVNKSIINDSLKQIETEIQQNGKLSKQRANEIFDYMYSNLQTKNGNYYFDTVDSSYEILDRENFDRNLEPLIQELKLADRYNKEELSNTTSIKDTETLKEVYNQISIKQKEYDKISNKEVLTKRDRAQVDRLINKEITIDELPADVNKKGIINVYNAKYELAELKKETQNYRKQVVSEYRNLAQKMTEDIRTWRDKKAGWKYQINTMKRNLRDIIPNKAEAQKMYDTYFKPITKNNAMIEKEINNYNERISKYEINNQESTYIQMIGEYTYNPESKISNEVIQEFYNKNEKKIDIDKCNKAVEEFRNIYNELFEKINTTLLKNGYKPVDYRKGYFPHFIEDKSESVVGKLAEKLGWKIKKDTLPTDIAGITDTFKPGKAWTSFSQQRTGDATDYNALKGYDNYIRGAMDVIYHTEDIQKLRALENEIRYQYSSDGVKEKINEIYANNELDIQEQQNQITEVLDDVKNSPMGNFVTELKNYTNNLANKKATGDRGMEEFWSRETYSVMSNIQNRVSANMVGANISSALTNFIPITQAWSQTSTKNLMRGIKESIAIQFKDDGFADNSTFLTNRTKNADRLYKTGLDTVNDKLGFIFDKVDEFTSNAIVRAKYYDNIEKGMSIQEAMSNADEFAKDVIAGRSKGDMPTVFNKKNPVAKLFTAFQLEVNNQYGYMFKDIPTDLGGEAKEKLVGAFVKMFLGAFFYNMLAEEITGRKSAFSPIDIAIDSYKTATNENLGLGEKVTSIGEDLIGEAPFLGGVAGGGRLPIQAALPSASDTVSSVADLFDMNVENKTSAINTLKKELSKPLYYVALPFAGGQLKKTIEGLSMYNEDLPIAGSYTNSGKLRYTVSEDLGTKIKAGIFGQYSVKEAKEYFDEGYSPLTEKQTQELVELDIPMSDYRQYKNKLKEIDKIKQDEIDDGTSKLEMKLDYINGLELSNEQKNILANNTTTRKEKIDMSKYDEYSGLDEMDFAIKSPSEYKTIKTITNYETYNTYSNEIKDLKKKYSTDTQKKRAIVDYINDLPLNIEQKAVMIKLNYNSIDDNNPIIVNYINNLNIETKDKIEIFQKLGFTYKGGRLYD